MEYLTISDALQLNKPVDESRLNQLFEQIDNIPFDRLGLVCIERLGERLSIEAEGEISEEISVVVVSWLHTLKQMATSSSFIEVEHVRWEINITLNTGDDQAGNMGALLSSLVHSHDNSKLILL